MQAIRDKILAYVSGKTPEKLEEIVDMLLDTPNPVALLPLAKDDDPAVRLAVAEALTWSQPAGSSEENDDYAVDGRFYPLFEHYARDYGNEETTSDVAHAIMALVAAAPERTEEIKALIEKYDQAEGLFEGEGLEWQIYTTLLGEVVPEAPATEG